MSIELQLRRGTTAEHAAFTGANGEVTMNTQTKRLHVHDGSTVGGNQLALIADLTSALSNTVTTSGLTSALASYVSTTALNTTLAGYVTSTGLTSALAPYAKTADLASYVTSSSLTTTLGSYATTASVHNVPAGGTTGQVLTKSSSTDYALTWATPAPSNVTTVQNRTTTGTYTLALGDSYVRLSNNSGTITLMVPANASVAFPIGTQITAIWIDCIGVTIDKAAGVTLVYPDSLSLRKAGSSVTLTKVATDTWDIAGDMKVS